MSYKILVTYDTGNEIYAEYNVQGLLEFSWETLEKVKENLKRIHEHYKYYCEKTDSFSRYSKRSKQDQKDWEQKKSKEKWFFPNHVFSMNLLMESGEELPYSNFWCGFFESLTSAEIIETIEEDPKHNDWKIVIKKNAK